MIIVKTTDTGIFKNEMVVLVEPKDVGQTFTFEVGIIPYGMGCCALTAPTLSGPGVKVGYKVVERTESCIYCEGTGLIHYPRKKRVGLLRRAVGYTVAKPCWACRGNGGQVFHDQVPLKEDNDAKTPIL